MQIYANSVEQMQEGLVVVADLEGLMEGLVVVQDPEGLAEGLVVVQDPEGLVVVQDPVVVEDEQEAGWVGKEVNPLPAH